MEQNKYYIFTKSVNDKSIVFEAKFVEIINQTLIVTDYYEEPNTERGKSRYSIPLDWIIKIQPKTLFNNFMETP
jgi:hypothetical protein